MALTTAPTCSHCGYELDDEETWYGQCTVGQVHTGDCDNSELKCPNIDCGKTFHVRCVHEIKFMQVYEDGEEI